MRFKEAALFLLFSVFFATLFGQNRLRPEGLPTLSLSPEPSQTATLLYSLGNPPAMDSRWNIQLVNLERKHGSASAEIDSIKQALDALRESGNLPDLNPEHRDLPLKSATDIGIGTNFRGNELRNVSPPDNTVAVSTDGIVISVDNFTLEYYRTNGQSLIRNLTLRDFVNNTSLNGTLFDPKVIYDPYEDRFILVLLHGSTPTTNKVLIYFSKSNDPRDGWFAYQLNGNQPGLNVWFDYPKIGINNDELYISGNLFNGSNQFQQSMLFQIEKAAGYNGGSISFQRWMNIRDGEGNSSFTVVPASEGLGRGYGPGIFLVSGRNNGGSRVTLYDLTDNMSASDEKLNVFSVNVSSYSTPPNGRQQNSNERLATNDARVLGAFFLNRHLHYVLHANTGSAFASIVYGRIDVVSQNANTTSFGLNGFDYTFPNVASAAKSDNPTDKSAVIAFTRSGTSIFPEARVVLVRDDMSISGSLTVKEGTSHINMIGGSGNERWGDYSGISRRFASGNPEIWMTACFSENNSFRNNAWSTWVAQINATSSGPLPAVEFTADNRNGNGPLVVQFTDQSTNNPSGWQWSFPGGTPASSTAQNPTVTYNLKGSYDVTLTAANSNGSNSVTKTSFITVNFSTSAQELKDEAELKIYPNPFADQITVSFRISNDELATIELFSMDGKLVKTFLHDRLRPGLHELSFSTGMLAAGNYIIKIKQGDFLHNEKVSVVR